MTIQHLIPAGKEEDVPCACAFVIPATEAGFHRRDDIALLSLCDKARAKTGF
jgi:hypothetical protein